MPRWEDNQLNTFARAIIDNEEQVNELDLFERLRDLFENARSRASLYLKYRNTLADSVDGKRASRLTDVDKLTLAFRHQVNVSDRFIERIAEKYGLVINHEITVEDIRRLQRLQDNDQPDIEAVNHTHSPAEHLYFCLAGLTYQMDEDEQERLAAEIDQSFGHPADITNMEVPHETTVAIVQFICDSISAMRQNQ